MPQFVLKNNYFEFNGKVKKQLLGTDIGTKFAPTYASIFIDKLESDYHYSDDVFFIWTHAEENLAPFLKLLPAIFYQNFLSL